MASNEFLDDILRSWLSENKTVIGYVVLNQDGIPVKYHETLKEKAVHYASLVSDICFCAKKSVRELFPESPNEVPSIRLRTNDDVELIITSTNDYTLVAIQNCGSKTDPAAAAAAAAAASGAAAAVNNSPSKVSNEASN